MISSTCCEGRPFIFSILERKYDMQFYLIYFFILLVIASTASGGHCSALVMLFESVYQRVFLHIHSEDKC